MKNKKNIYIKLVIVFSIMISSIIIRFKLLNNHSTVELAKKIYTNNEIQVEGKANKNNVINDTNNLLVENNIKIDAANTIENINSLNETQKYSANKEAKTKKNIENNTKNNNIITKDTTKTISNENDSKQTYSMTNVEKGNTQTEAIITSQTTNTEQINIATNNTLNEKSNLANTSYTKVNNIVINEVINILNGEIAKNKEFKNSYEKYGIETKALSTTKENATKNTSAFTYMFVKDIKKGKIEGNYILFKERVMNQVKAFGFYYVYAEDEFVYDSKGEKAYWSQTLCYVYNTL